MANKYSLDALGATPTSGYVAPIEESTLEEASFNATEVKGLAKESLDFLAAMAMPEVYKFAFPPVFLAVWEWLTQHTSKERAYPKLALGLPRGFSKTTVIKLYMLYCILFTSKRFILIISSSARLAEGILSDVMDMLDEPNIKTVFGDWRVGCEKDTQQQKKFGFCGRNITLAALGTGASLRGLNLKNSRPDVMIFDDIQTREDADSEVVSSNLETWMLGTAMKAKSPFGCTYVFLANMYPTKWSLLKRLKKNTTWIKFIAGGILADGTSLWEELHPLETLLEEFRGDFEAGHPEIFYAEVLNDEEATANNTIDLSMLPSVPSLDGDTHAGNFIIIDPATDKVGADAVSVGYFEIHDTYPVLMDLKEGCFSPGETIRVALEFALTHNCGIVAIESNAYQYSLNYWFKFICDQQLILGIEAVEIYSGTVAKNSRILAMLKSYATGDIFVHPSCVSAVHSQITQFNPKKRDNTDGLLDLLTYAPKVMEIYGEFITNSTIINLQHLSTARVRSAESNSTF